ncbi:MAG: SDR family oxidoreductase [Arthrobacter sp.]
MARVAIIGGHGKVALQLAKDLAANGHQVSSLFRNPDHVSEVAATGADPVVADVEKLDAAEIAELLGGHDAVVWSAGAGGGSQERTYAVDRDAAIRSMEAAEQAGVKRYVMVSYMGAGTDHGVDPDNSFYAYAEAKAAADEHLRRTGLDWTILGPSALTDDPGTGRISTGPAQDGSVSRADVAAVAAEVLEQPGTVGRFIEFINGETPIREAVSSQATA